MQVCMECPPGTYNIDIASMCKPCPAGAVCTGGRSFSAAKDHWQDGLQFYRCVDDKCCVQVRVLITGIMCQ